MHCQTLLQQNIHDIRTRQGVFQAIPCPPRVSAQKVPAAPLQGPFLLLGQDLPRISRAGRNPSPGLAPQLWSGNCQAFPPPTFLLLGSAWPACLPLQGQKHGNSKKGSRAGRARWGKSLKPSFRTSSQRTRQNISRYAKFRSGEYNYCSTSQRGG